LQQLPQNVHVQPQLPARGTQQLTLQRWLEQRTTSRSSGLKQLSRVNGSASALGNDEQAGNQHLRAGNLLLGRSCRRRFVCPTQGRRRRQ